MQIETTATLRVLGKITWVVVGFTTIHLGQGAEAIIQAFIIGDIVIILGSIFQLDITVGQLDIDRVRSLLTFGRYVFIGSLGSYTYSWMDVAVLQFFVHPSIIGADEIAWRVAALSMMVTNAIRGSIFPEISKLHTEGKLTRSLPSCTGGSNSRST